MGNAAIRRTDRNMTREARRIIAQNMRLLREARDWSQEDLAGASEIDRSYISEVENEHKSISADKVEKLARAFGVDIYEMFHPETGKKAR